MWLPGWRRAGGRVSAGSDGERVEIVGEDRPAGPGSHPVMALQAGAAQAGAALEVADAALGAGAVARGVCGCAVAGLVAAGELDLLVGEVGGCVLGRAGQEASVGDDLAGPHPGAVELGGGLGQQPALGRVARRVTG